MLIRIAAVVCLAAMLASCGGVSSPSENKVDTPSGTVSSGGAGPIHTFNVSKVGEFFVTITTLAPDPNIYVGVIFGQPANGSCALFQQNVGTRGQQVLGGQIEKGTWCVQVYDAVGAISPTTPTSYTLRLSYP